MLTALFTASSFKPAYPIKVIGREGKRAGHS